MQSKFSCHSLGSSRLGDRPATVFFGYISYTISRKLTQEKQFILPSYYQIQLSNT
jgi:hypothetical protein